MAQRRFGPTLDAGTVIIEKESERTITPSALGTTGYVGILDRGPVGELIATSGKRDLLAKTGGYIPDSLLPDAARDFWDHSDGAGILLLIRVTDGNEKKAAGIFYDRSSDRNAVMKVEAKSGGGWAGRRQTYVVDLTSVPGDIPVENKINLPIAFHPIMADQFKGGTLTSTETGKSYEITGNDKSDGTTTTELRLNGAAKLKTDFGSGTDPEFIIEVGQIDSLGQDKNLAIKIMDGQLNPSSEFGIEVYVSGDLVKSWPDLSMDPNSSRYFPEIINEDGSNHYITVTDQWYGNTVLNENRPANYYASVASSEITATALDLSTVLVLVDSSLASDNTIAAFTFGAKVIADVYEVEYAGPNWTLTSLTRQKTHSFTDPVDATPYTADNPYSIGFTVSGVTPVAGEKFTLTVLPLVEDEAIGGRIFLDGVSGASAAGYLISDNDEKSASIQVGDLTLGGSLPGTVPIRLEYAQELGDGYDGIAELSTTDFLEAYDLALSKFNETADKGYGLIKFATPGITALDGLHGGITATSVEKAGAAYAEAKNHQYRYEIPSNITDEFAAKSHVQDTLGKNTYSKVTFPSWGYVSDPVLSGRLKLVPLCGQIQGWEARVSRDYDGYHKVASGIDVKFARIVKLPTGTKILNGEVLNPAGLQRIMLKGGNWVHWGARIPSTDPAFTFCQHRELLSYYEHVLQESFDYIIFAINDEQEQPGLVSAMQSFFLPEWRKRALRGNSPEEAFSIKIDAENNTNLTRALGDMNAEVKLRLADTIERFIITISKAGVFESLDA